MTRRSLQTRIGEAVREQRKAQGYNQEDFADQIDMNRGYYGELERGNKDFRISTLERICAGLKVPVSKIISDAESK
jgi:transcriptional regulator with XRE-family HTH domain